MAASSVRMGEQRGIVAKCGGRGGTREERQNDDGDGGGDGDGNGG